MKIKAKVAKKMKGKRMSDTVKEWGRELQAKANKGVPNKKVKWDV